MNGQLDVLTQTLIEQENELVEEKSQHEATQMNLDKQIGNIEELKFKYEQLEQNL